MGSEVGEEDSQPLRTLALARRGSTCDLAHGYHYALDVSPNPHQTNLPHFFASGSGRRGRGPGVTRTGTPSIDRIIDRFIGKAFPLYKTPSSCFSSLSFRNLPQNYYLTHQFTSPHILTTPRNMASQISSFTQKQAMSERRIMDPSKPQAEAKKRVLVTGGSGKLGSFLLVTHNRYDV